MFEQNSYQAYAEASLVGASPAQLVTALYKGAIDAAKAAQRCLESGDIMGRSRSVTKIVNILTELMLALDHEKGGELAMNLKRLYSYMQQRALAAHLEKRAEPLLEVEKLLGDLLEAWYVVAATSGHSGQQEITESLPSAESIASYAAPAAGEYGYVSEGSESRLGAIYSF